MDSRFRGNDGSVLLLPWDAAHMARERFQMQQASFFGMPEVYAPAGKCSCISGVHADYSMPSALRFSGCRL